MQIRAMVVDDSSNARRIISHHLLKIGCVVVGEAENATQAAQMFRALKPQLVTLDVMMPQVDGMDSLAAFRLMRSEDPTAAIVMVSAVPFEKTRDSFLKEGAVAYMIKPFNQFSFEPIRQKLTRMFPELHD